MAEKTNITVVQNASGQPVAVKIGEARVPVTVAAPIMLPGRTGFTLTIADVEIAYEQEQPPE